jgi:CheY-like chemotaxis protein
MAHLSILLVEDNADDCFLTTRVLKKLPCTVSIEVAKNGDEALQRLLGGASSHGELPSLVLLDLQLPKIDGIKFLGKIRERYTEKELLVIILSSSDNPLDIAVCRELGVSGYLAKPLELSALQKILQASITLP